MLNFSFNIFQNEPKRISSSSVPDSSQTFDSANFQSPFTLHLVSPIPLAHNPLPPSLPRPRFFHPAQSTAFSPRQQIKLIETAIFFLPTYIYISIPPRLNPLSRATCCSSAINSRLLVVSNHQPGPLIHPVRENPFLLSRQNKIRRKFRSSQLNK